MTGAASLIRMMPKGYEQACYETRAIVRKRDIKDPNDLMMLALFHLLNGCTLIEVSEISKLAKLGDISDVAFLKRFKNCNEWFKWIINATVSKGLIEYEAPESISKYRVLAVDASDVVEKGASGRTLRLHFALDIFHMHAALYKITENNVGEQLCNFDFEENDLIIADRAYTTFSGIEYCYEKKCQFITRMRTNCFKVYNESGESIDLLALMQSSKEGHIHAFIKKTTNKKDHNLLPIRICYKKKTPEAVEATRKKLKRRESKKQNVLSEETLLFNEYIVLATSLTDKISFCDVFDLYKCRWQVELYFKRLKSILGYGDLPKKTAESIFSWLNGKLMIALLMEKMLGDALFSPYYESYEEYLEGNQDDVLAFDE